MEDNFFSNRLSMLRIQKNVSAREISLSLGQNPGYINNIESGKSLPSLTVFSYICEYLGITEMEFFDSESKSPGTVNEINALLLKMTPEQIETVKILCTRFVHDNQKRR